MAKLDITPHERSALRAAAHPLRPVVLIGAQGLSESVLKEIDLNLSAHELIKVRVAGEDRQSRDALMESVCNALSCAPVHHLGRTLILYRPRPEESDSDLPVTRAVRKPSEPYTPKKLAAQGLKRTGRNRTVRVAPAAEPSAGSRRATGGSPEAHNIPRRKRSRGSALTLRAGMRRTARNKSGR